jgi:hypothetical protein
MVMPLLADHQVAVEEPLSMAASNRTSNGNNSGVPAKKPAATVEYKFTLKKEGKVQTTFVSMIMKITNFIQQTYEGGGYVATSLTDLKLCSIPMPPPGDCMGRRGQHHHRCSAQER